MAANPMISAITQAAITQAWTQDIQMDLALVMADGTLSERRRIQLREDRPGHWLNTDMVKWNNMTGSIAEFRLYPVDSAIYFMNCQYAQTVPAGSEFRLDKFNLMVTAGNINLHCIGTPITPDLIIDEDVL